MKVGLLITGNEVVCGKMVDENGRFLSKCFAADGIEIVQWVFCRDHKKNIVDAIRFLSLSCDCVILTGGLGPTSDDLTSESVAEFFSVSTEFSVEAWNNCIAAFQKNNRTSIPESNKKQAILPVGCEILPNSHGSAVGFKMMSTKADSQRFTLYALPGFPHELKPMFTTYVLPDLVKNNKYSSLSYSWFIFNVSESELQQRLRQLEQKTADVFSAAVFSYQAQGRLITLVITFLNLDEERLKKATLFCSTSIFPYLEQVLGPSILTHSKGNVIFSLSEIVFGCLQQNRLKLSGVESCTGGMISDWLCKIPGASQFFEGCFVTYTKDAKKNMLGIEDDDLDKCDAVSEKIAIQMALAGATKLNSNVSFAVTGFAGPDGGLPKIPLGTVWCTLVFESSFLTSVNSLKNLCYFGWQTKGVDTLGRFQIYTACLNFGNIGRAVIQERTGHFILGSLVAALKE